MAYQTKSGEFFDYLTQLLTEKKVNDMIQILSDATSADPTLNGDLKFLKLRANKKLMVAVGETGSTQSGQIKDVINLIRELKNAHSRRSVLVNTIGRPSKKTMKKIRKGNPVVPKKKVALGPWIFLLFLIGSGVAAYVFRDAILQNESVQKIIPERFLSETDSEKKVPAKNASSNKTTKKTKKPTKQKQPTSKAKKESKTTAVTPQPISSGLGKWYIQVANYGKLDQAMDKRKRVEMSFDQAVILQKNSGSRPNYRIVIPGFANQDDAENFKENRKVENLYVGSFSRSFASDCGNLQSTDETYIYWCK
ncbi:MAG: SPOR domain-containing protein [Bacteroidota bacterium]